MSATTLNKHKMHNYLTRLRSILDCIENEGDEFVNKEVSSDIIEALEFLDSEFRKVTEKDET